MLRTKRYAPLTSTVIPKMMIKKIIIVSILINTLVLIWCGINVVAFESVKSELEASSFKLHKIPNMTDIAVLKIEHMSEEEKVRAADKITSLYVTLAHHYKLTHKSAMASFSALSLFSIVFLILSILNVFLLSYVLRFNNAFNPDANKDSQPLT